MKLALQLALLTGALVLGGALHAAARAWPASPGLAVGLGAGGAVLAIALVSLLLSSRAEDRDHLTALLNTLAAVALGVAIEGRLGPKLGVTLPPGALHGGLVLLVASWLCARIALRRVDFSAVPTTELIRATARSDRAFEAAVALLPARADALDALTTATTDPDPVVRQQATRLLGAVAAGADPAGRARAVAAAARALEASEAEEATLVAVSLAASLAHPDLIAPLRRVRAGTKPWALLEARAACGDLDVIDDLLAAKDADPARDVARALGAAALPALAARLARASDDDAARLLALVGALPRSDEAYALAADRAGPDAPPKVRAAALRALSELDPARAAPLARAAVESDDLMVRTWAQSVLRAAGET